MLNRVTWDLVTYYIYKVAFPTNVCSFGYHSLNIIVFFIFKIRGKLYIVAFNMVISVQHNDNLTIIKPL